MNLERPQRQVVNYRNSSFSVRATSLDDARKVLNQLHTGLHTDSIISSPRAYVLCVCSRTAVRDNVCQFCGWRIK